MGRRLAVQRWLAVSAEQGWEAWALELRGRNGSRPQVHLGRVRIRDFAIDVREALDHIGDAVLVGHSMGGLVAQVVAASDPRVLAAGFLCSVPPRGIVAIAGSCSTASSPIPGRWLARSRWGRVAVDAGCVRAPVLVARAIRVLDWAASGGGGERPADALDRAPEPRRWCWSRGAGRARLRT